MPDLYWPLPIFVGLVVLLTGVAVFVRDPSQRLNQILFGETVIIFFWTITNSLVILSWDNLPRRIFWDHWTYASGFLMAPTFSIFSCYLPNEETPKKWLLYSSAVASAFFASVVFFPGLFPKEIGDPAHKDQLYPAFYALFFTSFVLYGLGKMLSKYRHAQNPLEKKQLKILGTGLVITFTIGIGAGIIAPMTTADSYVMNLVTVSDTLFFTVFAGYAVAKYGFMAPFRYAMIQIFKSFHAGILVTDYSGKIVRCNQKLLELLEEKNDIGGRALFDFVEKAAAGIEPQSERRAFTEWLTGDEDGEKEFFFAGKQEKSLIITRRRIQDSHGLQLGVICTFLDNTERKRLERELHESRDHLESLLENASDIIVTCDKKGKIMSANKMAIKLSGLREGEWHDRSIFDFIPSEQAEKTYLWARDWVRGQQTSTLFQLDLIGADRQRIPLETSLNLIESNGEIVGVQAIARDLRARLQAERKIRELQKVNEQIVQNAPTGIFTVDVDGVFVTVNPAFADITGFASPADLIGKSFFDFPVVQKFSFGEPLQQILNGETLERTLDFHTISTDKEVNIKAFGTPLINEEGKVTGALIIVADLAHEKKLERQLVQSEKLSSIGKLISGVAHELNNPLTAIMGYSQFLSLDTTLQEKPRQMVRKIEASAERCRKTVANLLGYVRMKAPEKRSVNLNELLDKTLELREYDFHVKNVTVRKQYQPNLPLTAGDPDQLQQVFLSLINNAFDAMQEKNRISGLLEISTCETPENCITIAFADNGPGIMDEIRNKIFDPFFTTKPVGKGTGFGLSLSFGIIRSHGGSISLDTSYRGGAKFTITIPIEQPPHRTSPLPVESASEQNRRVLLVDDEEQILECTKMLLESRNYQVTTASNGEEAKAKLCEGHFDLIVSDLRMPGAIDGRALYHIVLKEAPDLAEKMVFITGDTLDPETYRFLTTIPNYHVKKPFTSQELTETLAKIG